VTIRLGGVGHIAEYAMTGADVRRTAVPRTISMALALGRAIREAREQHRSPFAAIADVLSSTLYPHVRELCAGKVVDVERRTTEGFAKGRAMIAPLEGDGKFEIRFQNENLTAHRDGALVAIVPDLICVVDHETAEPITTEGLRYGQRVRVLGISTPEMMRTPPRWRPSDRPPSVSTSRSCPSRVRPEAAPPRPPSPRAPKATLGRWRGDCDPRT
jgi:DUF917 family protein